MRVSEHTDQPVTDAAEGIRLAFNFAADSLKDLPNGRRKSTALTHLETASFWAIKAAYAGDK